MAGGTKPLPGMEDQRIEAIREKGLKYQDIKLRRMELTKQEVEARDDVVDVMHEHKIKRYFDQEAELLIELEQVSEEKVIVRCGKAAIGEQKEGADPDEPIAKNTMKPRKKSKPNADAPRGRGEAEEQPK